MNAYLLVKPIITEKSLRLAAVENTYTFLVARTAAKKQIQNAVEQLYGVNVESVNTVRGHRSTRATGRRRVKMSVAQQKKALVKLQAGQKIAVFDITN